MACWIYTKSCGSVSYSTCIARATVGTHVFFVTMHAFSFISLLENTGDRSFGYVVFTLGKSIKHHGKMEQFARATLEIFGEKR